MKRIWVYKDFKRTEFFFEGIFHKFTTDADGKSVAIIEDENGCLDYYCVGKLQFINNKNNEAI